MDSGKAGAQEYVGVSVTRQGQTVGAVYLTYRAVSGGFFGAITETADFVLSSPLMDT